MKADKPSCMNCSHGMRDPNADTTAIITGKAGRICICNPPTSIALVSPQGVVLMTVYPRVDAATIACHMHIRELPMAS